MTTVAMAQQTTLSGMLRTAGVTATELAAFLDGLDEAGRVREVQALPARALRTLWTTCADAAPLELNDFVPASLADGAMLTYAGKNNLPLFSLFEKRFTRQSGAVIGYNHSAPSPLIGPGYFTVLASDRPKELLFDYDRVPAGAPAGWPQVQRNDRGVSWVVFRHLHDFCRRVATGVVIGEGTRRGKEMGAFFVLARRPGAAGT
jgi:hypothetical protein